MTHLLQPHTETLPGQLVDLRIPQKTPVIIAAKDETMTACVAFQGVDRTVQLQPLRAPKRATHRRVTKEELEKLAAQNPPPSEWLAEGEECPF
jgi:hypothetical protein